MLGDAEQGLREQISGGVDGGEREGELEHGGVEKLLVVGGGEPIKGVVGLDVLFTGGGGGGARGVALLDDGADDDAGLGQHGLRDAAGLEEAVDNRAHDQGPLAELLSGVEGSDGVFLGDAEPVGVAAELLAEEDAGGDAGDELQDGLADVGLVPFWTLCQYHVRLAVASFTYRGFHRGALPGRARFRRRGHQ